MFVIHKRELVTDTGEVTLLVASWLRHSGRQLWPGSFNNAAVGTGLDLSNGAQLLDRNRQVTAHFGDVGMTMLLGEFMNGLEHRMPVKIVVYHKAAWDLGRIKSEFASLAPEGTKGFHLLHKP